MNIVMGNLSVLKTEETSVLIRDKKAKIDVWVDVWKEKEEVNCDWNMYIFDLTNSKDLAIRKYQESADNFDQCTSLAREILENLGRI
jgi:hypothetical protein